MNVNTYLPDQLANKARGLGLIGPTAERGLIARIVREGLQAEVSRVEREREDAIRRLFPPLPGGLEA